MARRRMLMIDVMESDSFITLTPSAQALYLHLNMNADDDGVVGKWKTLLRSLSIRTIHLDALINADFVLKLDGDILLITDWPSHNKIRADRYTPGRYKNEVDTQVILKNGRYCKRSERFWSSQNR